MEGDKTKNTWTCFFVITMDKKEEEELYGRIWNEGGIKKKENWS